MTDFIGRGEMIAKQLITNPFKTTAIHQQVALNRLISFEEFRTLDEEWQKHKFDLVLYRTDGKIIVIEVNYQHKEKAAKKGGKFKQMLARYNIKYVTIDDYDCDSIFKLNSKKEHVLSWTDLIDVANAFKKAGIEP